ncbi:hypothetical protein LAZ67_18001594 [Cordylochernes scorpioides]|uniref:Uncharacterized protein n=1 Tax=Cordylochernes scorpioides TaxID=51811 RepID=A0ABY6LFX9_9ARAC|nr:hypothetical protein LAZ67_18001594 [Cordylochernes scorpioides]
MATKEHIWRETVGRIVTHEGQGPYKTRDGDDVGHGPLCQAVQPSQQLGAGYRGQHGGQELRTHPISPEQEDAAGNPDENAMLEASCEVWVICIPRLESVLETRLAPCVLSTGPTNFYPARSPDLTPLDFFLWGTVKDGVYKRKPRNLDILWNEIQAVCREISLDVLIRCTESVVTRTQKCIDAASHQFEQY